MTPDDASPIHEFATNHSQTTSCAAAFRCVAKKEGEIQHTTDDRPECGIHWQRVPQPKFVLPVDQQRVIDDWYIFLLEIVIVYKQTWIIPRLSSSG